MMPEPRLRLKRSTGWFAAGREIATALPMLSDAAFKLYVFLCLNVDRSQDLDSQNFKKSTPTEAVGCILSASGRAK